jgi:Flp pilus assembly protein TadG
MGRSSAARRHRSPQNARSERGQATVEFALLLPLVAIMVLLAVQVVVIGQNLLLLQHGVREAARACAVDAACDASAIVAARAGQAAAVEKLIGDDVTISASATVDIFVPGLSALRSTVELNAAASFAVETHYNEKKQSMAWRFVRLKSPTYRLGTVIVDITGGAPSCA